VNYHHEKMLRRFLLCAVVCFFLPSAAYAHVEQGQAAGFLTGLEHPWSGLDHILAMVAVGLWGAQLGNPAIWVLPIAFPMMMAAGGMMGLLGIPVPGVEAGIAVSAIILGLMVLLDMRAKLVGATLLVGFFAIFHGFAHGTELPPGQSALLYSMGFVIGTGCLHGVGILIGLIHRYKVGKIFLRGGGAFIMIMGCFFLWQAVS
jgi:urease accessory protein